MRILIADDMMSIRQVMSHMLKSVVMQIVMKL